MCNLSYLLYVVVEGLHFRSQFKSQVYPIPNLLTSIIACYLLTLYFAYWKVAIAFRMFL